MDNSHHQHQQDDPIHLGNLVSTEPEVNPANNSTSNKIKPIDSYSYDSGEKNLDLNNDKQFHQPQPQQQQQQQQYPIQPSLKITNASHDALNMTMGEKDKPSHGAPIQSSAPVAAPRMKFSNLVDKVRVAKNLQESQPDILAAEVSGGGGGANKSLMLSPVSTNTLHSPPESGHGNQSLIDIDMDV